MATRKGKGRGAPGKAKSAAHKAALSKALKAFHANKRGKKRKAKKNSTARRKRKTNSRAAFTKRLAKKKVYNSGKGHIFRNDKWYKPTKYKSGNKKQIHRNDKWYEPA